MVDGPARVPLTPRSGGAVLAALALVAACGGEDPPARPASPAPHPAATAETPPASPPVARARPAAQAFVDEASCAGCHAREAAAWGGSDHDLAMQPADEASVLGDFADARFQDGAAELRFTRAAEGFCVEAEGPSGERETFPVPYVFGVDPLQQVLLPLPRGRLQALTVAWDRAARQWYSLYPGEALDARDPLHWTRGLQNWNFSCAECHATDLRRNYDAARDAYATSWHRLDVGCQACHGPAGGHLEWLGNPRESVPAHGFEVEFGARESWVEIEACARCHARRAPLGDGFDHTNRLLDDYLPALLTEGLYHADGQILDEVYEYGSFLRSKMHARGVRCSDCHEPHALTLRSPGNLACTGCHSPTPTARAHVDLSRLVRKNYDTPEHHHHTPGTAGSRCVDCHMPRRTYMGVDARRDHGFFVPRPDLSAETGAPDACGACHAERGSDWAAERIVEWTGTKVRPGHFGTALQAARAGRPGAAAGLLALARSEEPAIVRATALLELADYPSREALEVVSAGLADADGLVRLGALGALEALAGAGLAGAPEHVTLLGGLLGDPLRAVRIEAARQLAGVPPAALGARANAAQAALAEFEAVQRALLERPEARLSLAHLYAVTGRTAEAEAELRAAIRLEPAYVPGYANLADIARTTRGEREAEGVLRDGLGVVPEAAALHHALGLALVRQERREEGLAALERAAELGPEDARFGFVLGVALNDLGRPEAARAALRSVLERHPEQREARFALASYLGQAGDAEGARAVLAELAAINPYDPGLGAAVAPPAPRR